MAREPDSTPLELEIRRVGRARSNDDLRPQKSNAEPSAGVTALAEVMTLRLGEFRRGGAGHDRSSLDIVAHIRGRGDVRFLDTPWVGRLGPGLWIEAFTIVPDGRLAARGDRIQRVERRGTETPWLDSGALCGTRGRGIPLIGFAVRQKAVPGDAPFDCEYTGYFQSGATAGPTRNGAPCRSTIDNDALEGMQLRITPRPTRRAGSKRA